MIADDSKKNARHYIRIERMTGMDINQMNAAAESGSQHDNRQKETQTETTPPDWRIAPEEVRVGAAYQGNLPMNVGNLERMASLGVGAMTLFFLARRLLLYLIFAGVGAYLILRGMTGHCMLYARANLNTRRRSDKTRRESADAGNDDSPAPADQSTPEPTERGDDLVTEASRESFPASDPPSFYR